MKRVIKVNYADEIKRRVTSRELFQFYGFEINRGGFCKSPFSPNDKTPSLKVYDGGRGWHDFSSGNGGSVIDFVMQYFNLTFPAAIDKINKDFHLGLPIGKKLTPAEQKRSSIACAVRNRNVIAAKTAHKRLVERYNAALDKFTELDKKRVVGEANAKQGIITDDFAESLREIETAKYELQEAETRLWEYEQKHRT